MTKKKGFEPPKSVMVILINKITEKTNIMFTAIQQQKNKLESLTREKERLQKETTILQEEYDELIRLMTFLDIGIKMFDPPNPESA